MLTAILAIVAIALFAAGLLSNKSSLRTIAKALFSGREPAASLKPPLGENTIAHGSEVHESTTGSPLLAGNGVELLVGGPEAYRSMLDAIQAAQNHIHLESYVFEDGEVADQFAYRLIEKADLGVSVNVLYDALGSWEVSQKYLVRLKEGGVQLRSFQSTVDLRFWRIHQRDHRKLLVVDGTIGFIGGINISDTYLDKYSAFDSRQGIQMERGLHDIHTRVEGPVVAELQRVFLASWLNLGGQINTDTALFPQLSSIGNCIAGIVATDRLDVESRIMDGQIAAIQTATHSVRITHAYFIPHGEFLHAIIGAVQRGVDVQIILPSFTDHAAALYASHAQYQVLLESGARIFEYQPRMLHSKTILVDDMWSTIGSSNIDIRSLDHNNEANLVVLGKEFAQQMRLRFEKDLQSCKEVTIRDWLERPLLDRCKERASMMLKFWL